MIVCGLINPASSMERLKSMLIEFLPGYTIRTLKLSEPTKVDATMRDCITKCKADSKLAYLVHIACANDRLACLTNGARNEYYSAVVGEGGLYIDIDVQPDALRRNIEQLLDMLKMNKLKCDICIRSTEACDACACKYNVCNTCYITLIYNALRETHTDIVRCPNCRISLHRVLTDEEIGLPFDFAVGKFLANLLRKYEMQLISEAFFKEMWVKVFALV